MAIQLPEKVETFLAEQEAKVGTGRLNIYTCTECGGHIVTKDVDTGVTPFMVGCRATKGCEGMMQSSMYRVFDQNMKPTHEWYRPDSLDGLTGGVRQHVENGGLLLREAA